MREGRLLCEENAMVHDTDRGRQRTVGEWSRKNENEFMERW